VGAERWDEQVGSVADEAARLLESLRRTAADAAEAAHPAGGEGERSAAAAPDASSTSDATDARPGTAAPATDGGTAPGCTDPFCQWCPLCRTSAVVRSLSPETLSRLADLAGVAAAVLADLASARGSASGAAAGSAAASSTPGTTTPEGERPSRARPIPVRDADDPQEEPRG